MNNDDILNLANDFGYQNDTRKEQELWSYMFPVEKLLAFANACEKIGMEKLRPINWTKEMSDAWHQNIPDVNAAFHELIKKAT